MTRLLVGIAWMYVVVLMAVAEAGSPDGTLLGAIITFALYGVLPLGIVLYLLGSRDRRARRAAAERTSSVSNPDRGGHAAGDTIAPEREEP